MIKSNFNNLSLSNVQLRTDIESKDVPKNIADNEKQAEKRQRDQRDSLPAAVLPKHSIPEDC